MHSTGVVSRGFEDKHGGCAQVKKVDVSKHPHGAYLQVTLSHLAQHWIYCLGLPSHAAGQQTYAGQMELWQKRTDVTYVRLIGFASDLYPLCSTNDQQTNKHGVHCNGLEAQDCHHECSRISLDKRMH